MRSSATPGPAPPSRWWETTCCSSGSGATRSAEALLEIPAGTRDVAGEDASVCAAREVLEETGHRAISVEPLGWIYASPGFLDERVDLFLIEAEPAGEPEEGIEVVRMPLREAVEMAVGGGIRDGKSVAGLLLAARRREQQPAG